LCLCELNPKTAMGPNWLRTRIASAHTPLPSFERLPSPSRPLPSRFSRLRLSSALGSRTARIERPALGRGRAVREGRMRPPHAHRTQILPVLAPFWPPPHPGTPWAPPCLPRHPPTPFPTPLLPSTALPQEPTKCACCSSSNLHHHLTHQATRASSKPPPFPAALTQGTVWPCPPHSRPPNHP
jgi:hypothetical protein